MAPVPGKSYSCWLAGRPAAGDPTVVYLGHGNDTTLGAERPHLAESWAGDAAAAGDSTDGT